jgi:hypothetical protein
MNPKYPIYVISKNRWELRPTSNLLERLNIPYHIVIEPQEYNEYSKVIDQSKIYVLPFSNLGKGSIPARNWVWEHSISIGAERHWILDDNIYSFWRLNRNRHIQVHSGVFLRIMEDFTDRYKNVVISGPHNLTFVRKCDYIPPYYLNTRVYSCILIKNSLPFRWRGRYNEDTDLCIRALKNNFCTILFTALTMDKATTMVMKGGNTDELYKDDGRLKMAQSLQEQHPDIVQVTEKWGRYQHHVDYSHFKKNKLILNPGVVIPQGVNNYGMVLQETKG